MGMGEVGWIVKIEKLGIYTYAWCWGWVDGITLMVTMEIHAWLSKEISSSRQGKFGIYERRDISSPF